MRKCLPLGYLGLLPTILVTMGWGASVFQDGCNYARISELEGVTVSETVPYLQVGYTAYREPHYDGQTYRDVYRGSCLQYPIDLERDIFWQSSKLLAFGALVLGGGATIFLWFSTCCLFSKGTWRLVAMQVFLASIVQSLVFLWFLNSHCGHCRLSGGSVADIVAASLWMFSALLMFCHYPKPRYATRPSATQDGIVTTNTDAAPTTTPEIQVELPAGSKEATIATQAAASSEQQSGEPTGEGIL